MSKSAEKTAVPPAAKPAAQPAAKPTAQPTAQRKGFTYYFNSETIRGRANVAKATLGTLFVYFIYRKFFYTPKNQ